MDSVVGSESGSKAASPSPEVEAGVAAMRSGAGRKLASFKKPQKAEDNQASEKAGVGEGTVKSEPAKADKPAPVDRSFLSEFDESLRGSFDSLPDEALDHLHKKMEERGLRQQDYTQKTMEVADEKRRIATRETELRKEEEALRFGKAILDTPPLLDAVRTRYQETQSPPVFDHQVATPEEFTAYISQQTEAAVAKALSAVRSETSSKDAAASEKYAMAKAVKEALVDTGEYEPKVIDAAYDKWSSLGVQFTKGNVVDTLRDLLPKSAALAGKSGSNGSTSGASPLARNGNVAPRVTAPAFIQQGRAPTNDKEVLAKALYEVNARRVAAGQNPITTGS